MHTSDSRRRCRTAIVLLLLWFCSLTACGYGNLCGNDIREEITSPDRSMRAVSFVRGCGATTAFSDQVSLLRKEEKFGNEAGNVFVADDDHGAVAKMDVQVHWETNDALVIRYPAKARIFLQVVKLGGVRIRYESY